jgi:hypothetical protein
VHLRGLELALHLDQDLLDIYCWLSMFNLYLSLTTNFLIWIRVRSNDTMVVISSASMLKMFLMVSISMLNKVKFRLSFTEGSCYRY